MANIGYKYRANIVVTSPITKKEERRDTNSLINGELYASKFKDLNDPFEGSVELPNTTEPDWVSPLLHLKENAGVYSMSKQKEDEEYPCNELLWAHYANSHKGFCIEYDLDKLDTCIADNITYRIDVVYQVDKPIISPNDEIKTKVTKAFSTKSLSWIYENEYRLIFNMSGVKKIAFNAIRAIYFGLNMPLADRDVIINGLKSKGIKFYQMEQVNNGYKLSARRII